MNNRKTLIVLGGLILSGIIGFALITGNQESGQESVPAREQSDTGKQNGVSENSTQEPGTRATANNDTSGDVATENRYTKYSPEALAAAAQNGGQPVIFFHASWCPMCRAADAEFRAKTDQIPENVTILKADFDTEEKLKEKHDIVMQDTFVLVDAEGNEIKKWQSGGKGISTLLANI